MVKRAPDNKVLKRQHNNTANVSRTPPSFSLCNCLTRNKRGGVLLQCQMMFFSIEVKLDVLYCTRARAEAISLQPCRPMWSLVKEAIEMSFFNQYETRPARLQLKAVDRLGPPIKNPRKKKPRF